MISYIKLVAQINLVHNELERYIEKSIQEEGLDITKVRAMILNQIQFKGSICQKTIAELNNITPQAIHRHIKILEESGYIIRKKSKNDARRQNFSLTPSGKTLINKSRKIFISSLEILFKDLNKSERKTLILLLSKIKKFDIDKIISH